MTTVEDVRGFWEKSPLWTGESKHGPGTPEFFDEHRLTYIADCLGGAFDDRCLPPRGTLRREPSVLDLGCGIGFWVSEFARQGFKNLHAADLTEQALVLTRKRYSSHAEYRGDRCRDRACAHARWNGEYLCLLPQSGVEAVALSALDRMAFGVIRWWVERTRARADIPREECR
jgi:SAM-dependent methyltransferase